MISRIKIILVAGARPNFMKIAPLMKEMDKSRVLNPVLVHTGQHYDERMSDLFFKQLSIPKPGINLGVGSASHAVQTARIMERFEKVCFEESPDAVLVVGDVNSTAATVLTATKLGIETIHYEAGLRSYDRSMPEEINRVVTDAICDILFTTSGNAITNLLNEGKSKDQIHMVGNLMIDSLVVNKKKAEKRSLEIRTKVGKIISEDDLKKGKYCVATFHRPNNVDKEEDIKKLINTLEIISEKLPVIFPLHPRTLSAIYDAGLGLKKNKFPELLFCDPLGYLEFLKLIIHSKLVITDSGGIQEETTYLGIPCLTLRPNTERPVTIIEGTNKLTSFQELPKDIDLVLKGKWKRGRIPEMWDGKSAGRIVKVLEKILKKANNK